MKFCDFSFQENFLILNPSADSRPWITSKVILTLGFHGGSLVKNLPCKADDAGSNPGLGDLLENEMATHSSIRAWRILWTEEPGRLHFMGSQRIRHDLVTKQQQYYLQVSKCYLQGSYQNLHVLSGDSNAEQEKIFSQLSFYLPTLICDRSIVLLERTYDLWCIFEGGEQIL